MRIGLDARLLYASELKGIGRYLQYLVQHLVAADAQHDYVMFYDPAMAMTDRLPATGRAAAVPVRAGSVEAWEQWALPQAVRAHRIELFHSPANTTMVWGSCPIVVTLHDVVSHQLARQWGWREYLYWNVVQRCAYRRAARFITPSAYAKQQLEQVLALPARSIRVVHHGIGSAYRPADPDTVARWTERVGIRRPYLFVAGAKLPYKNIPTALHAFDLLAGRFPQLSLVISSVAGNPAIEQVVAQLRHGARVVRLPHLDEPAMVAAYSGAEAFVFPSLNESFGFPQVEAMACGAPVIASDAACIPEVVGDGALLVDCRRPEPLAEAIVKTLNDPALRAQLIARGLKRAEQFTWERAARATLAVYNEALRG